MWGPCVKWSVGMHWLGITVDHREKSHHWCDGKGCLESKELSVVKVRHQHTQGVIDGEMLEKCQGLVWDWHLQRRTEEALQCTHSLTQSLFLLAQSKPKSEFRCFLSQSWHTERWFSESHTELSVSTCGWSVLVPRLPYGCYSSGSSVF